MVGAHSEESGLVINKALAATLGEQNVAPLVAHPLDCDMVAAAHSAHVHPVPSHGLPPLPPVAVTAQANVAASSASVQ